MQPSILSLKPGSWSGRSPQDFILEISVTRPSRLASRDWRVRKEKPRSIVRNRLKSADSPKPKDYTQIACLAWANYHIRSRGKNDGHAENGKLLRMSCQRSDAEHWFANAYRMSPALNSKTLQVSIPEVTWQKFFRLTLSVSPRVIARAWALNNAYLTHYIHLSAKGWNHLTT